MPILPRDSSLLCPAGGAGPSPGNTGGRAFAGRLLMPTQQIRQRHTPSGSVAPAEGEIRQAVLMRRRPRRVPAPESGFGGSASLRGDADSRALAPALFALVPGSRGAAAEAASMPPDQPVAVGEGNGLVVATFGHRLSLGAAVHPLLIDSWSRRSGIWPPLRGRNGPSGPLLRR